MLESLSDLFGLAQSVTNSDNNLETPANSVLPQIESPEPVVVINGDCSFLSADLVETTIKRLVSSADIIADSAVVFLETGGNSRLAFNDQKMSVSQRVLPVVLATGCNIWFIGDLHGDILALEVALEYIARTSPTGWRVVFLGDLFDDAGYGIEVMLRAFELACNQPENFCFLTGNHDEALYFDESTNSFSSSVIPDDLSVALNNRPLTKLGQAIISLYRQTPRALLFSDGLLATHGGFPLSDVWDKLNTLEDLQTDSCLQDFVWTRIHDRSKRKIPNRSSKGCQYGYQDFEGFCERMTTIGLPVTRMVRGHDHLENRFETYDRYIKNPVLTINSLSRRLPRESGVFERTPCIARHVLGKLPEVHRLEISPETVRKIYSQFMEAEQQTQKSNPIQEG